MKFTKIRLVGLETIELKVFGASLADRFQFKGADGLGPPESTTISSKGLFQGRNTVDRQIVFRVGLNPDYKLHETPADLREELYTLLATDDAPLRVEFVDGQSIVAITEGHAAISPAMFTETPEAQITIDCIESFLRAPYELVSTPTGKSQFVIPNPGSAPTGFRHSVQFTSAYDSWTLVRGAQKMKFDTAFAAGDILLINTIPGERDLVRVRGTVETSLLHTLSKDSSWIMLRKGNNVFTVANSLYDHVANAFQYTPRYWGV